VPANAKPLRSSVGEDRVDSGKLSLRTSRDVSSGSSRNTSTTGWEDYDALKAEPGAVVGALKDRSIVGNSTFEASEMHISSPGQVGDGSFDRGLESAGRDPDYSPAQRPKSIFIQIKQTDEEGRYLLTADDSELQKFPKEVWSVKRRGQMPKDDRNSVILSLLGD